MSEKKVSINELENAINGKFENIISKEWIGIDVKIKRVIGVSDMIRFVRRVVDTTYEDDSEFMPEATEFAFKSCLVEFFTNLRMPSNAEKQYDIIYGTDIVDVILDVVSDSQIRDIRAAIKEHISHRNHVDALASAMKISELTNKVEAMVDSFGNMFDGISGEDIKNIAKSVVNNKIDEEKLVSAFVDSKDSK